MRTIGMGSPHLAHFGYSTSVHMNPCDRFIATSPRWGRRERDWSLSHRRLSSLPVMEYLTTHYALLGVWETLYFRAFFNL